jgi:two-component sensor histidine kinase
MIEAVLEEVRERFDFDPILVLPDELDIDLIGHRFHFFYDTLWILVSNAAEYGLRTGGVRVEVVTSTEPDGRHVRLTLAVTSVFVPADAELRKAEIDEVMAADIGDAMESEDGTGLRKVRSLVAEAVEIVGFGRYYEGGSVRFVLDWRYPLS